MCVCVCAQSNITHQNAGLSGLLHMRAEEKSQIMPQTASFPYFYCLRLVVFVVWDGDLPPSGNLRIGFLKIKKKRNVPIPFLLVLAFSKRRALHFENQKLLMNSCLLLAKSGMC